MEIYDEPQQIELNINGENRKVMVRPADTLLRVLREKLGLTGSKIGCENGDCGACTVLVNGTPVKSCMTLALDVKDEKIVTIEGLNETKIQEGFLEKAGFQCGFCTPGFLLNSYALLEKYDNPDDETIKEWLQSNICRCTGYEGIREAIQFAIKEKNEKND